MSLHQTGVNKQQEESLLSAATTTGMIGEDVEAGLVSTTDAKQEGVIAITDIAAYLIH